jgi:hypothetical protein
MSELYFSQVCDASNHSNLLRHAQLMNPCSEAKQVIARRLDTTIDCVAGPAAAAALRLFFQKSPSLPCALEIFGV